MYVSLAVRYSYYYILLLIIKFVANDIVFITLQDIGAGKGRYYAVNFPLRDGIDDDCYETVFEPVSSHASINQL